MRLPGRPENPSSGENKPKDPFKDAVNAVNDAMFAPQYDNGVLKSSITTLLSTVVVGIKAGDVLETARRYSNAGLIASQAATVAKNHGDEKLAEEFTRNSEELTNVSQFLKEPSKKPQVPPAQNMSDPKR